MLFKNGELNLLKCSMDNFQFHYLMKKKNTLFLIRDRIGIVPIYFKKTKDLFVFCSQIKPIRKFFQNSIEINNDQIIKKLSLPYKLHGISNHTLFDQVFSLKPGSYLQLNLENLNFNQNNFVSLSDIKINNKKSYYDFREELKSLLIDSIKIRLRTDRKYGFILSGGIDSSSILGIAKKELNVEPYSFSLDIPDQRFNENNEIKEILEFHNMEKNFIKVTSSNTKDILFNELLQQDEPLPTPNFILHNILASQINDKGIKVVLNGVGGDEILLGYHDHFLYHLFNLEQDNSKLFNNELFYWEKNQKRTEALYKKFKIYLKSNLSNFNPDFLARSQGYDYLSLVKNLNLDTFNKYFKSFKNSGKVLDKQINDISSLTIPHSVKMDDTCYLSHAVETRQPFLDYRLINLCLSMPSRYKIKKGIGKFILRQAVRGFIPETRRRDIKKIGLNLPIDEWFKKDLFEWIEMNCHDKNNEIFNYLDFNKVQEIILQHQQGLYNHSLKIWDICCIQTWLSNSDKGFYEKRT